MTNLESGQESNPYISPAEASKLAPERKEQSIRGVGATVRWIVLALISIVVAFAILRTLVTVFYYLH